MIDDVDSSFISDSEFEQRTEREEEEAEIEDE